MKRALLTVVTVLIGVLIVAGSVMALSWAQEEPAFIEAKIDGTASTPQGDLPHATLDLEIYPNTSAEIPGPRGFVNSTIENNAVTQEESWPLYWPSTSLKVPAHSVVTIRVKQYDNATTPLNRFWADVHGTMDGTATYNGQKLTGIKPEQVAHTFTIHQYPESGQPTVFLSVPMLAVPNNAKNEANGYPKPQVIEFSFVTGDPGEYVWNCEDPCGDSYQGFGGVMQARGWMSGKIEVV
ncbi:MAG: hypothetical protein GC156_03195 [Actinomycetales bacterium]|nr:hypothetical protein [Actinomycetales bacterium]